MQSGKRSAPRPRSRLVRPWTLVLCALFALFSIVVFLHLYATHRRRRDSIDGSWLSLSFGTVLIAAMLVGDLSE